MRASGVLELCNPPNHMKYEWIFSGDVFRPSSKRNSKRCVPSFDSESHMPASWLVCITCFFFLSSWNIRWKMCLVFCFSFKHSHWRFHHSAQKSSVNQADNCTTARLPSGNVAIWNYDMTAAWSKGLTVSHICRCLGVSWSLTLPTDHLRRFRGGSVFGSIYHIEPSVAFCGWDVEPAHFLFITLHSRQVCSLGCVPLILFSGKKCWWTMSAGGDNCQQSECWWFRHRYLILGRSSWLVNSSTFQRYLEIIVVM